MLANKSTASISARTYDPESVLQVFKGIGSGTRRKMIAFVDAAEAVQVPANPDGAFQKAGM